jgi:hypothetical protein
MDAHTHLPTWMLSTRDGYVSRERLLAERHRMELRLALPREPSLAARLVARLQTSGASVDAGSATAPACCPA